MEKEDLFPFIVADIGGTNARFGLATELDATTERFTIAQQHVFECAQYSAFEDVLGAYLDHIEGTRPAAAVIAIAGPVSGDRFKMTNLSWDFSLQAVRKQFGMERLEFMNDFGAQAYATLYMHEPDLSVLYSGIPVPRAPRVILGPGTGLGVAGLVNADGRWFPLCGEGGHIKYAPASDKEVEVRRAIAPLDKHISIENMVSGPGLLNIYKALAKVNGATLEDIKPGEISKRALAGSDPVCVEALQIFLSVLGGAAGDVALVLGAQGGVYLGGGILPKVESLIGESALIDSFLGKGIMSPFLHNVPVYLMKGDKPALAGAAHWLYDSQLA